MLGGDSWRRFPFEVKLISDAINVGRGKSIDQLGPSVGCCNLNAGKRTLRASVRGQLRPSRVRAKLNA